MIVSYVIPAHNEEESIGETLDEINDVAKKLLKKRIIKDYEIIVVNNNCSDKTEEIAKSKGAKVIFENKKGYGAAYKTGLKNAIGDVIITGDADASYPFCDSERFLKELENCDFITTNRFAKLEEGSMPMLNYFGNIVLTFVFRIVYLYNIKDSQSGMWIFKRSFLNEINLDLLSDGMAFSEEIKAIALMLNKRIKEIPIIYRKRVGSSKLRTFSDGLENLKELFRFKIRIENFLKNKN
ncbi:MAG: hypothetical protein PWP03_421 [Candidatus Woesearchaeota archaeon]|nr:hypothetical protein [Candidatus Woesearchaeota archaeon]MDN5327783.1 hypothetical protein [Candidatus Woesearchaeota archaeon]